MGKEHFILPWILVAGYTVVGGKVMIRLTSLHYFLHFMIWKHLFMNQVAPIGQALGLNAEKKGE